MADVDRLRELRDKLKPTIAPADFRLPVIEDAVREVLDHLIAQETR